MAEKTGEIEKLIFPFNTAGCLEVYIPNLNGWYRSTAREFRSFDGYRRITEPTEIGLRKLNVEMITYDYEGPVYLFGTNKEVHTTMVGEIVKSPFWDKAQQMSGSRKE